MEEALREGGPDMHKNFNFVDPPIRDGCRLGNQTGDWTVIRYQITFPAASMLYVILGASLGFFVPFMRDSN